MRYFVIGDDGQKYGPADLATLNSWIGESRLLPTQQLEEESSGVRMAASAVQGLNFPVQSTQQQFAPGQPYQQHYARPTYGADDGSKDVKNAWICFVFSLLCCGLIGIVCSIFTITNANKALAKGNQAGNAPKILGIITLVLSCLTLGGYVVFSILKAG